MSNPDGLNWSTENCTIERATKAIGGRWAFIVLREIFTGINRFDDMRVRTNIPKQVLADQLGRFLDEGIVKKVPYKEPGHRTRNEYRLTDKGIDLYPILLALAEWGDKYEADPDGPPVIFVHRECGALIELDLVCGSGHHVSSNREVALALGSGAKPR